ncbi:hypothetical protein EYF80_048392 [Liparis tanakae]|uniref:Uncharacterized protein n=1 Tax=Liparis tanakae TaxID=230148 RepID=A0A4Z2FKL8_9TELE|nr:hypothetical protein EYF80_048392 [Liparis tanakae]
MSGGHLAGWSRTSILEEPCSARDEQLAVSGIPGFGKTDNAYERLLLILPSQQNRPRQEASEQQMRQRKAQRRLIVLHLESTERSPQL